MRLVPHAKASPAGEAIVLGERGAPSRRAVGAPIGATVRVELFSAPGALVFVAAGVQRATRRFTTSVDVPKDPRPIGQVFRWQAPAGTRAKGFFLSNPATYVVDSRRATRGAARRRPDPHARGALQTRVGRKSCTSASRIGGSRIGGFRVGRAAALGAGR